MKAVILASMSVEAGCRPMGQTWAGVYSVVLEETVVSVKPCEDSSNVGWQRSSMLAEVEAEIDS